MAKIVAKTYLDKIKVDNNQIELELMKIMEEEEKNKSIKEINLSEIEVTIENKEEEKFNKKSTDSIKSIGLKKLL